MDSDTSQETTKQFSRQWWLHHKDLSLPWAEEFCAPFFKQDPNLNNPEIHNTVGIFFFNTPEGETIPVGMTAIEDGNFIFQYHPDYVANSKTPSISVNLPKRLERYIFKGHMASFFDNLLAEGSFGEAQKRALTHGEEVGNDAKALQERYHRMMMFSRDCPGAVWGTYEQLDPEIAATHHQAMIEDTLRSRASISGVQPKLLGTLKDGVLRPTDYWETSTHIVKLESPKMKNVLEYEYMSLKATKALLGEKDDVSEAELSKLHLRNGATCDVLAIKRFDRTPQGGKIHFEEFNQLLDKPSSDRYKGAYHEIADFIRDKMGEGGVKKFYARLMSQFLLGNTDSHFKNFAMFHDDTSDHWALTPSYDLAPTSFFCIDGNRQHGIALEVCPLFNPPSKANGHAESYGKHVKRMKGGDHYRLKDFTPKILVSIGESFGLQIADIREILNDLRAHIPAAEAAIMSDPSPRLNARASDNSDKTLRQVFCERLKNRREQLFWTLDTYLGELERRHPQPQSATFTDRPKDAGEGLRSH